MDYNIHQLDDTFTIDDQELDIYYELTSQGVLLKTYYKGDNYKIHYIDSFDDYYDEYELLYDLHLNFIESIRKEGK
jgi:hypothetical protein